MNAKFETASFSTATLVAANAKLLIGRAVALMSGPALPAGAVLGQVAPSGKYQLSATIANSELVTDGSQIPSCILAESSPARLADAVAMAYFRGDFDAAQLSFGEGHSLESTAEALRELKIFTITTMA